MASFTTQIGAPDGGVTVMTRSRFLGLFKRPTTSVIPSHGLGIQFRWTTDERDTLEYVHRLIVNLASDIPCAEIKAVLTLIYNVNRETTKIGQKLGAPLPPAPFPEEFEEILQYVKGISY